MTTHGVYDEPRSRCRETESGTWSGQGAGFYSSARRRSLEYDSRRPRRSGGGRKRRRPWPERLCDWLRSFVAFLFSNVGIVCLVIGYTIAGAFIFVAIESSHEHVRTINVSLIRNTTATSLWQLTSEVGLSYFYSLRLINPNYSFSYFRFYSSTIVFLYVINSR